MYTGKHWFVLYTGKQWFVLYTMYEYIAVCFRFSSKVLTTNITTANMIPQYSNQIRYISMCNPSFVM